MLLSLPLLGKTQIANWAPINTVFPTNISGQINGLGRVSQLKFDPTNSQNIYAACVGGLFASNDNGLTWHPTGTDTQLPPTACASSCIDYNNGNIIYLGTGDANYYSGGYGVWKSTNGGTTWLQSTTGMGNALVIELLMDPLNSNNIVAATSNGIYKTTNAGGTWGLVKSGGDFKNMVKQPGSNTILYAVTSSQFWRSVDFGTTWIQITNGVVIPGGGSGNGMRIAVSSANAAIVYVGMVKDEGTILKSVDGGLTFTTVYHTPTQSLVGYDATGGGQGDYNFSMTCDPTNASIVYLAAHCVWKSIDAGVTWTKMTDWAVDLHTDMHHITFNPTITNQLFNANDGGVWLNTNGGVTTDWHPRCNGLYCAEFYNAAQSDVRKDMIDGGLQDNGEEYFSNNSWKTNRGGDWDGRPSFSYVDDRTVYYNTGNRRDVIANGGDLTFNFPVTTQIEVMEFNRKKNNLMFAATNNVYRSKNIHLTSPTWSSAITTFSSTVKSMHSSLADTNILYVVAANNKIYRSDNVLSPTPTFTNYTTPAATNLAASVTGIKNNVNVVYLTCGSKVYRSANKGATWVNISSNLPTVNISKIYHDHFSTNEAVYVCNALGVYYKDMTMTNWVMYSQGLPTISNISNLMIYNDSLANSAIDVYYYGRGIWRSPMVKQVAPYIDFTADKTIICAGQAIQFTEQTAGNATAWNWSFPNGTPSTSSSQNPSITYTASGIYPVTLTATNSVGSANATKTAYITVSAINALPLIEGFAVATFPPTNWQLKDANSDGVTWIRNSSVGSQSSSSCMQFDNFNNSVLGTRDEIITPKYNFTSVVSPTLAFDVAYQTYSSTDSDTLVVLASTDCGVTFNSIYTKGGATLASVAGNTTSYFSPANNSQWRTETINLSSYIGQPNVMFSFQNRNHYGQSIYVDNINISSASTVSIKELEKDNIVTIFPNPTDGKFTISIHSTEHESYSLTILNSLAQIIYSDRLSKTITNTEIDMSNFSKGIYWIKLSDGKDEVIKKIVTY